MKHLLLAVVVFALAPVLGVVCAVSPGHAQSAPPTEIAGFRLGDAIGPYASKLDREITEEKLVRQYLTVSALLPVPGFRSGYVTYGNCVTPNRIVRIKMNYEDESKGFYEQILAALKKRYGEPQEWRGNPFGTLRTWKWSFTDGALGDVSLILQHYSGGDNDFTRGNSIRLAANGLNKAESDCYFAKHPERVARISPQPPKPDFEALLPR